MLDVDDFVACSGLQNVSRFEFCFENMFVLWLDIEAGNTPIVRLDFLRRFDIKVFVIGIHSLRWKRVHSCSIRQLQYAMHKRGRVIH
jgi:hypothetical protein